MLPFILQSMNTEDYLVGHLLIINAFDVWGSSVKILVWASKQQTTVSALLSMHSHEGLLKLAIWHKINVYILSIYNNTQNTLWQDMTQQQSRKDEENDGVWRIIFWLHSYTHIRILACMHHYHQRNSSQSVNRSVRYTTLWIFP